ncbi:unnamed protein product [Candida verbasci]|uniref:F-actin-capping protein subunit beta n=1 Tax=Candida verbasci TaxID=1227364 RepID=A0A9W4TZK6_9ASCO|nr:unnamed protein product [Candida verbasci]
MSDEDKLDSSLSLLRRLDPRVIESNLTNICTLLGSDDSVVEELLSSVDVPLKIQTCKQSGKDYLCCDYNRDADSYRSPWSNKYYPEIEDNDEELPPPYPSSILRQLEIKANDSFDIYRDLYYEGSGVSSVYLWDTSENEDSGLDDGFAGVVLFKKETSDSLGKWDSNHVFEVIPESEHRILYKLTTSVILDLNSNEMNLSLSGNLIRQLETSQLVELNNGINLETQHLINLGQLIEKSEYNIRNLLQDVYFDKLKDIMLKDLRSIGDIKEKKYEDSKQSELIKGLNSV